MFCMAADSIEIVCFDSHSYKIQFILEMKRAKSRKSRIVEKFQLERIKSETRNEVAGFDFATVSIRAHPIWIEMEIGPVARAYSWRANWFSFHRNVRIKFQKKKWWISKETRLYQKLCCRAICGRVRRFRRVVRLGSFYTHYCHFNHSFSLKKRIKEKSDKWRKIKTVQRIAFCDNFQLSWNHFQWKRWEW